MEKEYLFVYGTLLSSYAKNPFKKQFSENSKFIGNAKLSAKLYDLGEFPGIIENQKGEHYVVYGEVYELLNSDFLFDLDEYENYFPENLFQSEYIRQKVMVSLNKDDSVLESWTYWYKELPLKAVFIESGDYLSFLVD